MDDFSYNDTNVELRLCHHAPMDHAFVTLRFYSKYDANIIVLSYGTAGPYFIQFASKIFLLIMKRSVMGN